MDVKLMHRQGHSLRHIARVTGLSRVTVRRILSSPTPKIYGPRTTRPGKLDPFVPRLEALVAQRPRATASWLHRTLRGEGFGGGYERVKLWARVRRREERARARACVRFETGPGIESPVRLEGPGQGADRGRARDRGALLPFRAGVVAGTLDAGGAGSEAAGDAGGAQLGVR